MNGSDHSCLFQARKHAFIDRSRGGDTQRMAIQTSFAKKLTWPQDRNHRDLALLDVEDRVRHLSLRKNNLTLLISGYRFSLAHLREKRFGIKRGLASLP